jgi:hypothetical protein
MNNPGWQLVRLGEVCEINPSCQAEQPPSGGTSVAFVRMEAIDQTTGTLAVPQSLSFAEVPPDLVRFRENDVLLAAVAPWLEKGKAAVVKGLGGRVGVAPPDFHIIRLGPLLRPAWLLAFLRQASFRTIATNSLAGGQSRLSVEFLKRAELLLPPLAEQDHVIELFDRIDELLRLKREVVELIAQLPERSGTAAWEEVRAQSLLHCRESQGTLEQLSEALRTLAVTGELTQRWRESHPALTKEAQAEPVRRPEPPPVPAWQLRSPLLDDLSPEQRRLVEAIAHQGGYFTAEELREIAGLDLIATRRGLQLLSAAGLLQSVSLEFNPSGERLSYVEAYRALRPEDDGRAASG